MQATSIETERSTLDQVVRRFRDVLPPDSVITDPQQRRTYECDGL